MSTTSEGSHLPNGDKKIKQNAKPKRCIDLWGLLDPVPKQQEKIIWGVWGRI